MKLMKKTTNLENCKELYAECKIKIQSKAEESVEERENSEFATYVNQFIYQHLYLLRST